MKSVDEELLLDQIKDNKLAEIISQNRPVSSVFRKSVFRFRKPKSVFCYFFFVFHQFMLEKDWKEIAKKASKPVWNCCSTAQPTAQRQQLNVNVDIEVKKRCTQR
jgi:hypothetical protein